MLNPMKTQGFGLIALAATLGALAIGVAAHQQSGPNAARCCAGGWEFTGRGAITESEWRWIYKASCGINAVRPMGDVTCVPFWL